MLLLLGSSLESLPWERATVEINYNISKRFHVITPRLLYCRVSKMRKLIRRLVRLTNSYRAAPPCRRFQPTRTTSRVWAAAVHPYFIGSDEPSIFPDKWVWLSCANSIRRKVDHGCITAISFLSTNCGANFSRSSTYLWHRSLASGSREYHDNPMT
jgi:hypothetical protein